MSYIQNPIYISYTSLTDYLKCPRSYYLKNIYRDSRQQFRLQIINPYLVLGGTIHDTIKWYLQLQPKPKSQETLDKFRNLWRKYHGKRGGFISLEEETSFGRRGIKMLLNFLDHVDVLEPCVPFISFPKVNLVENVILIGNFDFVGKCQDESLHIIDFKTGSYDEDNALQLYIYTILAENVFKKKVSKASFWYLDRDDGPKQIVLDNLEGQLEWLKGKALELKSNTQKKAWFCIKESNGFCKDCRSYLAILDGKGVFLFSDFRYKKEIYYLSQSDFS